MQVGVIPYQPRQSEVIDEMLRACSALLKAEGYALAGAVQINAPRSGYCQCDMAIEDLGTGARIDTSDKARASSGCRLDSYALEDAAGLVQQSITPATDLVIINRFGKQEANGQGFRGAIEAAVMLGVPVLTSYGPASREAFDALSSGAAEQLPADADKIVAWCRSAIGARRHHAG